MNMDTHYRISELADEFGLTLRTLRFYEDKGLLNPKRVGNARLFTRSDRARLKLILLGKRLGFSLADLKDFLELYDPEEGNAKQLTFALERGIEQMAKLNQEKKQIEQSIAELDETMAIMRKMLAEQQPESIQKTG